jgi:light-independent protochlorophyllide reductase subunit B
MERHIAKRLGIPCAVISSPIHVQDFPARYSPQMGFEGANVLFDTWVHPLMMGLEEHLLGMFREDFEFNDEAPASHLGRSAPIEVHQPRAMPEAIAPKSTAVPSTDVPTTGMRATGSKGDLAGQPIWTQEAQQELTKIPFFVRGKARRNTERFAIERGQSQITLEMLYDAKAHYSR